MGTRVVNRHHGNIPPDAVYIGRGSKWGNPFSHRTGTKARVVVATREEAVERYEAWVRSRPDLMNSLHELRGKTLVCFCKPAACHGDVLVKLVKERFGDDE